MRTMTLLLVLAACDGPETTPPTVLDLPELMAEPAVVIVDEAGAAEVCVHVEGSASVKVDAEGVQALEAETGIWSDVRRSLVVGAAAPYTGTEV